MKEKELMIGDWVRFPIGNEKIIDLPYVEGRGICASFAASATLFPVEVDNLEPIPLTPEILEKNGFVFDDLPFAQQWEGHGLAIYDGRINISSFGASAQCKYVHQLQHVLRLCGIDKEISI